jgi:hypothetical protein
MFCSSKGEVYFATITFGPLPLENLSYCPRKREKALLPGFEFNVFVVGFVFLMVADSEAESRSIVKQGHSLNYS